MEHARAIIRGLITEIGLGYHPDTPFDDYVPAFPEETIRRFATAEGVALAALGDDYTQFEAIACEEYAAIHLPAVQWIP